MEHHETKQALANQGEECARLAKDLTAAQRGQAQAVEQREEQELDKVCVCVIV